MSKRPAPRTVRNVLDELQVPEVYREKELDKPRIGRPPSRPPITDEEAVGLLCRRLATGMSMVDACLEPKCPSRTAVYEGLLADDVFRTVIARAQELQQEALVDEMIPLADSATADDWQVVRLKIWARQWIAGKRAAKKYGDKIDLNHGGVMGIVKLPFNPEDLSVEQLEMMRDVSLLSKPSGVTIEAMPDE